jgi:hypothetical protein
MKLLFEETIGHHVSVVSRNGEPYYVRLSASFAAKYSAAEDVLVCMGRTTDHSDTITDELPMLRRVVDMRALGVPYGRARAIRVAVEIANDWNDQVCHWCNAYAAQSEEDAANARTEELEVSR